MAYSHFNMDVAGWIFGSEQRGDYHHEEQRWQIYYHGIFVDDMMHIYSCDAMKDEFLALYKKDFDITGGNKMETFLGMEGFAHRQVQHNKQRSTI